ncbi:hypothetical protein H0H81_001053 [Sphagnurus paluster]|uniref:Uncharacterized protein n=1 Tax=Sphagnurus paluster TaxID=117069 RepID=A0A9P7GHC0_9AGAR|nr:hypothetical protein H0H81_001053 [Sphagnurus paluster]
MATYLPQCYHAAYTALLTIDNKQACRASITSPPIHLTFPQGRLVGAERNTHPPPGLHVPIPLRTEKKTYHVLPLTRSAFCARLETGQCSWQAIFCMAIRSELLWEGWARSSLGSYADVKALWETWDEVGTHQRTKKGKLPTWQPRKNVQPEVANGKTASVAVQELYSLHAGRILAQSQVATRLKHHKKNEAGESASRPVNVPSTSSSKLPR